MEDISRVYSFSINTWDNSSIKAIKVLKQHSRNTGITFSRLVLKALINLSKELEATNDDK